MLRNNDWTWFRRRHAFHTMPAILIIVSNKWRFVRFTIALLSVFAQKLQSTNLHWQNCTDTDSTAM